MSQHFFSNPQHSAIDSARTPLLTRRAALGAALAGAAALIALPAQARAAEATKETTEALEKAQQQLDEAQAQLDDISYQFEDLSVQLDDTMGKIENVQGQIDDTQANIDDTQDSIDETQDDIEEKQEELGDKQEELSRRVVTSYKSGGNTAISLLLSSESFDELISKAHYIDKVNQSDKEAIDEVHRIQDELAAQKAALEQQKTELEQQKTELESQRSELEGLKATQVQQLDDMKAKKDEVQKILDGLSQDVKDLMAKRDAEILEAARQEEEARKLAEQAAASSGGTTSIPGSGQSAINAGTAQQRIVDYAYSTPSPGAGLCAWWVSDVFERAGFGNVPGNADDMYANFCTSSNKANLKVGMIIAVPTHPHTSAGRIYGHVGIYVGDNIVRDNIGYIRTIDVDEWISYYGTTSTPRWGWANGVSLEGR